MSKRCLNCQKDVKLTNVKKVKSLDYEGGSQKKIDIIRFTDIDVKFDVKYEGHQNCPEILLCTL